MRWQTDLFPEDEQIILGLNGSQEHFTWTLRDCPSGKTKEAVGEIAVEGCSGTEFLITPTLSVVTGTRIVFVLMGQGR